VGVGGKKMIKKSEMVASRYRAWKWKWQALVVDPRTWSILIHLIKLRRAATHAP
jgi:hypothetical protein